MLSPTQKERYSRQIALPEIRAVGQERLAGKHVLLIGAGGLGSSAGLYLAAAGIGRLTILDGDVVDMSNLQRQIWFQETDIGRPKAQVAVLRLKALNSTIHIEGRDEPLTSTNASAYLSECDLVIDATDNFDAKFLIADICYAARRPSVHAGILAHYGQLLTVIPGETACYRCVFEAPPSLKNEPPRGPLGAVPGVMGSLEAMEAIKIVLGIGELFTNRVLSFHALTGVFRIVPVKRRTTCSLCGCD